MIMFAQTNNPVALSLKLRSTAAIVRLLPARFATPVIIARSQLSLSGQAGTGIVLAAASLLIKLALSISRDIRSAGSSAKWWLHLGQVLKFLLACKFDGLASGNLL